MLKRATCKQLWKGIFSYHCELVREYAYAYTKRQAWLIMCRRLAKKHDVQPSVVMRLFDGSKDNFSIKIEMEITEVTDDKD